MTEMEDKDFTIVENKEEIKQLRDELKNYLPFSVSVFNTLLMILKGSLDLAPILVDRRPGKPTICLIKQGSGEYPEFYYIIMYCAEERKTDLMDLLRRTTMIRWLPCVRFIYLHDSFVPAILEVSKEKGLQRVDKIPGLKETFAALLMFPENCLVESANSLPSGYQLGALKPEDFVRIHDNLPYKQEIPFETFKRTHMKTKNSAIFFETNNEMVSWAVQDCFGQVGKLHTLDEHRNKGLGAFVLQDMKDRCSADGYVPYTVSERALDYLRRRGFCVAYNIVFLWLASPAMLKKYEEA